MDVTKVRLDVLSDVISAEKFADALIAEFQLPFTKEYCADTYVYDGGKARFSVRYKTVTEPEVFIAFGELTNDKTVAAVLSVGQRMLNSEWKHHFIIPLVYGEIFNCFFEASVVEFPVFIPNFLYVNILCRPLSLECICDMPQLDGALPSIFQLPILDANYNLSINIHKFHRNAKEKPLPTEAVEMTAVADDRISLKPSDWEKMKRKAMRIIRGMGRMPSFMDFDKAVNFAEQSIKRYKLRIKEIPVKGEMEVLTLLGCAVIATKVYSGEGEERVVFGYVRCNSKQYPFIGIADSVYDLGLESILPTSKANILGALLYTALGDPPLPSLKYYHAFEKEFTIFVSPASYQPYETIPVFRGGKLISPTKWDSFYRRFAAARMYHSL